MQFAAIACLPAVATLAFEWITGVTPANSTRAAAGLIIGAAVATLVILPGNPGGDER